MPHSLYAKTNASTQTETVIIVTHCVIR